MCVCRRRRTWLQGWLVLVPLAPLRPRTLMMRMTLRMKRRTGMRKREREMVIQMPCLFVNFMMEVYVCCLTGSAKRQVSVGEGV